MAWPRCRRSSCANGSGSPCAMRDLQLDEVEAGHHLGHRMLDLQARVHLEEVGVAARVHQELQRARVPVAGLPGEGHRQRAHALAQLRGHEGRRALLDHLLMAALDRALALEEVHDVAVVVGQDLDLDVARPHERLLEVEAVVAERGEGLAARALRGRGQGRGVGHEPQPLAASARRRLEHDREADALGFAAQRAWIVHRLQGARHHGHARLHGQPARRGLLAHERDRLAARPDEDEARAPRRPARSPRSRPGSRSRDGRRPRRVRRAASRTRSMRR